MDQIRQYDLTGTISMYFSTLPSFSYTLIFTVSIYPSRSIFYATAIAVNHLLLYIHIGSAVICRSQKNIWNKLKSILSFFSENSFLKWLFDLSSLESRSALKWCVDLHVTRKRFSSWIYSVVKLGQNPSSSFKQATFQWVLNV